MYDMLEHAVLSRGILHFMRSLLIKGRRFVLTSELHFSDEGCFVYLMQQGQRLEHTCIPCNRRTAYKHVMGR
jgi:hypothetical protein